MAFNNPYQMPNMTQNAQGGWGYTGANLPYVDNATELANQFGWADPRTQGMQTRDVIRNSNGQIMHGMNTGFGGLGTQMSSGFGDLADLLEYGGSYGESQNRVFAPQSKNGYGSGWGGSNPFGVVGTI